MKKEKIFGSKLLSKKLLQFDVFENDWKESNILVKESLYKIEEENRVKTFKVLKLFKSEQYTPCPVMIKWIETELELALELNKSHNKKKNTNNSWDKNKKINA